PEQRSVGLRVEADGAGRVVREVDRVGRAFRYEYDADGRLEAFTDSLGVPSGETVDGTASTPEINAAGNATRFRYDGHGRLVATETRLTTTGTGGGPLEHGSPYNPSGLVLERVRFDDRGRLIEQEDNAGYVTVFHYRGDTPLLERVEHPGSVASGGSID